MHPQWHNDLLTCCRLLAPRRQRKWSHHFQVAACSPIPQCSKAEGSCNAPCSSKLTFEATLKTTCSWVSCGMHVLAYAAVYHGAPHKQQTPLLCRRCEGRELHTCWKLYKPAAPREAPKMKALHAIVDMLESRCTLLGAPNSHCHRNFNKSCRQCKWQVLVQRLQPFEAQGFTSGYYIPASAQLSQLNHYFNEDTLLA